MQCKFFIIFDMLMIFFPILRQYVSLWNLIANYLKFKRIKYTRLVSSKNKDNHLELETKNFHFFDDSKLVTKTFHIRFWKNGKHFWII